MDINIVIPFPRKPNCISDSCPNQFRPFVLFHPIWNLDNWGNISRINSNNHILSCSTVCTNIARKINIITFGTAIGFCESIFGWAGFTNEYSTFLRTIHGRMDVNIMTTLPRKPNCIPDIRHNQFRPFVQFHPVWNFDNSCYC